MVDCLTASEFGTVHCNLTVCPATQVQELCEEENAAILLVLLTLLATHLGRDGRDQGGDHRPRDRQRGAR